MTERLMDVEFPRSNAYHPDWVLESASGGANSVWLADWLLSVPLATMARIGSRSKRSAR